MACSLCGLQSKSHFGDGGTETPARRSSRTAFIAVDALPSGETRLLLQRGSPQQILLTAAGDDALRGLVFAARRTHQMPIP